MKNLIAHMKRMTNKGQGAGAVWGTISVVFALFVLVIFLFAFSIAGGSLNDTTTSPAAQAVIGDGLAGMQAFSGLLNPIFVIAAIALLIAVLVGGVAVYIGMRR